MLRETKASIVEKLTMFASKLVMKADMFPELVLMYVSNALIVVTAVDI